MHRVIPFGIVYLPILTALLGLCWGGAWTWATFGVVFVLLPLLDLLGGQELRNPEAGDFTPGERWAFKLVTWLITPLLVGLTLAGAWVVSHRSFASWELAGVVVSLGVASGGLGITVAHELIHKTRAFDRFLGQVLLLNACYMHFYVEHLIGHHSRVATPEDPASARFGESLYAFLPRTLWGSLRSVWHLEAARLGRQGLPAHHPRNRTYLYVLLPLAVAGVLTLLWGPMAGGLFLAQGVLAFLLLEIVNYVEHYGLAREALPGGRYERVTHHHSWSCANRFSNWMTLQLQRHADHHTHPVRPYEELRFDPETPTLPTGYPGMIWLATVPPVWRRVMDPRVEAVRARVNASAR
ncbi:MAG: alkane 1-monooxygenase [Candidatus Sericytochromatia bacterium]|nr:alkane 1-monooxygenase [Candidatus Sericytochromatia bacterium]